ncbi:diguanylate cyclase [Paenibacillus sp. y28]|uniref:diguanylate cyclase n=1 Tax=Paenibacillus sp. y28 TaxID=3129110 RepID=UPI00301592FD
MEPIRKQETSRENIRLRLKESFPVWLGQLERRFFHIRGAVFLCDEHGVLIEFRTSYECSPQQLAQMGLKRGADWSDLNSGDNAVMACLASKQPEIQSFPIQLADMPELELAVTPILVENCGCVLGMLYTWEPGIDFRNAIRSLELSYTASFMLYEEQETNTSLTLVRQQLEKEAMFRDYMYQITKKLHSNIDVDSVLADMVASIKNLFPQVTVDLYLSQDNQSTSIPVKPLHFHNSEDDICTRAFMEGQLIIEQGSLGKYRAVAVPLCGKQGVYGVLHIHIHDGKLGQSDIQFISMLADTAGSAFENAKLYEQSNLLIHELRLINEITKCLNQSLKLNEIFNYACSELLKIFEAEYCCILEQDPNRPEELVVKASNLPGLYEEQFSSTSGFSGILFSTKEPLIISDYKASAKVESKLMELTGSHSLIASPILVGGEVAGIIMVTHRTANYFSYENYKLLQMLCVHISLAISNASLHAEVKRMVITDHLTGLHARHYLDEQINLLQKKDFCGSLIVVDIDLFKTVNDTYGHQIGDKILIQVSGIIRSSIRSQDIAARWGGEELAIYLPQISKNQALRIAERIRARVEEETSPRVTVSCGVSEWNWEEERVTVESLFYKADMALYEAKNGGRNQVQLG